jgi:hypothetical protein
VSIKSWFKSQDVAVRAAFVAACGTVAAGIAAGTFALIVAVVNDHPSAIPGPTASPVGSKASLGCSKKIQISYPPERVKVSGSSGVLVMGQACDLRSEHGWLFDFDYNDQYYHEDYSQNPGPVVSQNGVWSFLDRPVGSKCDNRTPYLLTLVLADNECESSLLVAKPVSGDYRFRKFPAGCRIMDSRVVYVTYP